MEGFLVKVTVLMGVYNAPLGMLAEAMQSIIDQTFRDFEFLIVDDGSEDPILQERLKHWANQDRRIRIACEPHRGLTASLNHGLALAQGEFIARQDADDWSAPDRIERQLRHFAEHPNDAVCGSNAKTHQQNGRALWTTNLPQTRDALLADFPRGNPFVHGSVMFRRDAALAAGGYCETFRCSQDYDFFWRLTERHGAANLPEPLYHYRYTRGSISAGKATDQLRAHNAIRALAAARQRGDVEDPAAEMARATEEIEAGSGVLRALLKQADHLMLAGDYRDAARAYLDLAVAHPANPLAWGKMARLGLFRTMPFLREACFR
jgi:glycosyltransferase involved in cell wall biosynthesis